MKSFCFQFHCIMIFFIGQQTLLSCVRGASFTILFKRGFTRTSRIFASADPIVENLNEAQRAAVTHPVDIIRVVAGKSCAICHFNLCFLLLSYFVICFNSIMHSNVQTNNYLIYFNPPHPHDVLLNNNQGPGAGTNYVIFYIMQTKPY